MDKMREEFEVWAFDYGLYDEEKVLAYTAWQASRRALCVDLPQAWYQDQEGYILNREDDIKSALEDAGVKYK